MWLQVGSGSEGRSQFPGCSEAGWEDSKDVAVCGQQRLQEFAA